MKKSFYGSLCYQGIRGGAICVTDNAVLYKNQTLTLPQEYKNIVIPFDGIEKVEKSRRLLLPAVTIHLKNHRKYQFVVLNRSRFLKALGAR